MMSDAVRNVSKLPGQGDSPSLVVHGDAVAIFSFDKFFRKFYQL